MEIASGFWRSLWQFLCFLPYFIGLLLLGTVKGIILCPIICVMMGVGNTAVILGLWPLHFFWTYRCVLGAKQLGPILKLVIFPCIFILLILWPVVGIVASFTGGVLYGFLSPLFATFDAVGQGKSNEFFHCIFDGTWTTVKGCATIVRDVTDVGYHSYFSVMDEYQAKWSSDGTYHEIRLLRLPAAFLATLLGVIVDVPVISIIAICKSPYMLLKGWKRLLHDLVGREGPFLETICVPFAGLAILLWPLAVVGAVLGSFVASLFLGAYAGVVAYVESSLPMGFRYIIASLSLYDEYSNDVLDMPEGSCFPRPNYGKMDTSSQSQSRESSLSMRGALRRPPSRSLSMKNAMNELKPLELLEGFFKEFQQVGENLVSEGLITQKDVEDAASSRDDNGIVNIGLPAYCILQTLIRSVNAQSPGILLSDNATVITSTNRPKDTFFDWFLSPLMVIRDQIEAENLTEAEEDYLSKLVLSNGNADRFKEMYAGESPASEVKKAELEALSRRLRGITKSISRYPTYRRRYECLKKTILEELARKNGMGKPVLRQNGVMRAWSSKSFKRKTSNGGFEREGSSSQETERDVEIQ